MSFVWAFCSTWLTFYATSTTNIKTNEGSTQANSYLWGMDSPQTRGSPGISWPRILNCADSYHASWPQGWNDGSAREVNRENWATLCIVCCILLNIYGLLFFYVVRYLINCVFVGRPGPTLSSAHRRPRWPRSQGVCMYVCTYVCPYVRTYVCTCAHITGSWL